VPDRFGEAAFKERSGSGETGRTPAAGAGPSVDAGPPADAGRTAETGPAAEAGLEEALGTALVREQFMLEYQPQLELATGRIVGAEALIRWHLPGRGVVMPGEFIPLAERSGRIAEIGRWGIRTACRQNQAWRRAGVGSLRVAVNVSAVQLFHGDIVDAVASALADSGLDGSSLELEITESVMVDPKRAVPTLERLKSLGVRVSIDDFGTGYSSLQYLKSMPIDGLKIDRSFIRNLLEDAQDQAIVMAIASMARHLGLRLVAEGVETADQLSFLRALGCDEIQGYYVSRPLPADRLREMLRPGGAGA